MKTLREMMDMMGPVEEGLRGGLLGEPDLVKTRIKPGEDPKVEAWQNLIAIVERGRGIEPNTLKLLKKIAMTLKPEGVPTFEDAEDPVQKVESLFKDR